MGLQGSRKLVTMVAYGMGSIITFQVLLCVTSVMLETSVFVGVCNTSRSMSYFPFLNRVSRNTSRGIIDVSVAFTARFRATKESSHGPILGSFKRISKGKLRSLTFGLRKYINRLSYPSVAGNFFSVFNNSNSFNW